MSGRDLFTPDLVPRAQLGDPVLLLGTSSFMQSDQSGGGHLFEVVSIEGLPLLGQHGAIVVWTQAGAIPAGYGFALDTSAASGTIGAANALTVPTVQSLKNLSDEVTQIRFLGKVFGTLPASWAVQDLDIKISQPGSTKRWSLANVDGAINLINQLPLASDSALLPSQGNNTTAPADFPQREPFEPAFRTELFIYKDAAPAITLLNNSGAAMNTSMGVALMIAGFRYKLRAITEYQLGARALLGMQVMVPDWVSDDDLRWRIPILPVAGRG